MLGEPVSRGRRDDGPVTRARAAGPIAAAALAEGIVGERYRHGARAVGDAIEASQVILAICCAILLAATTHPDQSSLSVLLAISRTSAQFRDFSSADASHSSE